MKCRSRFLQPMHTLPQTKKGWSTQAPTKNKRLPSNFFVVFCVWGKSEEQICHHFQEHLEKLAADFTELHRHVLLLTEERGTLEREAGRVGRAGSSSQELELTCLCWAWCQVAKCLQMQMHDWAKWNQKPVGRSDGGLACSTRVSMAAPEYDGQFP